MRARVSITTPVSTLVLADESERDEVLAATAAHPAALRDHASAGRAFFLATDDPVHYTFDLFVDEPVPPSVEEEYSTKSGVFYLRLPGGRLTATGIDTLGLSSVLPAPLHTIDLPAGNYLLTVLDRTVPDIKTHDARLRELLGEADWRYSQRVTRLGAAGCLTLIVAIILALIPVVRRSAWFLLPLLGVPELVYLVLTRLPRHRRIETTRRDYERSLPQYLLVLRPTEITDEIAGGWVDAR